MILSMSQTCFYLYCMWYFMTSLKVGHILSHRHTYAEEHQKRGFLSLLSERESELFSRAMTQWCSTVMVVRVTVTPIWRAILFMEPKPFIWAQFPPHTTAGRWLLCAAGLN